MPRVAGLQRLCRLYGVQTEWTDWQGQRRDSPVDSLLAVLSSLGAELHSAAGVPGAIRGREEQLSRRLIEPVLLAWDGEPLAIPLPAAAGTLSCSLQLEDGEVRLWKAEPPTLSLPAGLPFGRHVLRVGEARATLISAPSRTEEMKDRAWGVFMPLFALHSSRSWGGGDYTDLDALAAWTAEQGGRALATLPLLAGFLEEPCDPSPYAPASRLIWNEFYVDPTRAPEWEGLAADARWQRTRDELRASPEVDYRRQMQLKRAVMEKMAAGTPRRAQIARFFRSNLVAEDYARFRAKDSAELPYRRFATFLAHEQMGEVALRARQRGLRLCLDLPLGVHPQGYDAWRWKQLFARGLSVGAPPDAFFRGGQDWGFPPMTPDALRADGYGYLSAVLRHHLSMAGMLRIDHVMGMERLFCIPAGASPADGVYVGMPADEHYALLCLESRRHGVPIVGEDLGVVPDSTRAAMARHGLLRTWLLQFHQAHDPLPPRDCVAALNTHDTATLAAWRKGADLDDAEKLGVLDAPTAERERIVRASIVNAWRDKPPLEHIASSSARLALVNLEDLWGEERPVNVPGTTSERPNWRRKSRHGFEAFRALPEVVDGLARVAEHRSEPPASLLGEMDLHLFNEGTHLDLGERMGARAGPRGTHFSVWAPDARSVALIGDFNGWDSSRDPLSCKGSSGVWEGFVAGVGKGALYKFHVVPRHGGFRLDKADPFALATQTPPNTASVVWDLAYSWRDSDWMSARGPRQSLSAPMSVYEVHLGSWARVPEEGGRSLSYREIAPRLAEHVAKLGFTHVELMPIMEHPFFGSWGYQVTGFFAPTRRYGDPQDLMALIDELHRRGIGVLLDWVPSHFPSDGYALARFDGTCLYEHEDPRQGHHPDWNSAIFNYGRKEVCSFLLSSALHWLTRYHVDGLRVDAVASMLYLDYSRREGEWIPNRFGGRENLEAVDFLRRLNEAVYARHPDVQMIAEESTAWPMVSRPTSVGGLGFGLKWDMGWMHDMLQYMSLDPVHRRWHHDKLTFRMLYGFTENFVLSLSHDEVVHGKRSLLERMPGDDWQKFANLRLLYGSMYGQPGKKLLFMGCEFGQRNEWSHEASLDWHLLSEPRHAGMMAWVADLNRAYRAEPALHHKDCEPSGFEWVDCHDALNSTLSWIRRGGADEVVLVVCNFTPVPRAGYRVGVPRGGFWREILNSDATNYGGSGHGNLGGVHADREGCHGRPYSLLLHLPPLSVVFLKCLAS